MMSDTGFILELIGMALLALQRGKPSITFDLPNTPVKVTAYLTLEGMEIKVTGLTREA